MEIVQFPLLDLIPYEKNTKYHDKESINAIRKSINAFGFNQPILINQDNKICVGHGRYYAAKTLKGITHVPVIKKTMTHNEFVGYNLADNKVATFSQWDLSQVLENLGTIDDEELKLATGFVHEELRDIPEAQLGEEPPVDSATPNDSGFLPPDRSSLAKLTLTYSKEELADLKVIIEDLRKLNGFETDAQTVMKILVDVHGGHEL